MNRDFIIGLLLGILVALFIMWLFEGSGDDDNHDDRARQGTPKYSDNVTPLGEAS